jgi:regulation of enolase protein 1 (concanavalin A-like superfamily)
MRLPLDLSWEIEPSSWQVDADIVTIAAGPNTDYFIDPAGAYRVLNAPRATVPAPSGNWQLSVKVSVEFTGTYDAGATFSHLTLTETELLDLRDGS